MDPNEPPVGSFAEKLNARMEEIDVDIRRLAEAVDTTYEHTRRVVRGLSVPSNPLLRAICTELELDYDEMKELAMADKLKRKYGSALASLTERNPELEPLERLWPDLTDEQKNTLVFVAQGFAKSNKSGGDADKGLAGFQG